MVEELRLELLGGLQISRGAVPVTGFISSKVPALLCYLAVTERPHSRHTLAGLLWGDWPEAEALGHLRKAIHNLRQLLEPWLCISTQSVGLNREAPLWLDVREFGRQGARLMSGLSGDPAPVVDEIEAAAALYRGDFLAGFYVRGAPDFEEWVTVERERLRRLALSVLDSLAAHYMARHQTAAAIDCVARLLAIEPWREETHRQMMWLLARSGQRSGALAQYETCRRALQAELGVEPDLETTNLYRRILAAASPRPNNLPAQTTSFVGRNGELAHIIDLLIDSGCRLLTLAGPGGIGKTRLALEAAASLVTDKRGAFADGIHLVSLAPLRSYEQLITAIGGVVSCDFQAGADRLAQLIASIGDRELLLLLDSFEPIIDAAPLVADLLAGCPRLRVLATSRQPLNLRGEQQLRLEPLPLPDRAWATAATQDAGAAPLPDAVALFLDRARAVQPELRLDEHRAPVAAICVRLDGLPLAVELAAARSQELAPEAILARLSTRLQLLSGGARDLPLRQQTIRAAVAWSYDLLTPAEQHLFARLAVFADIASPEAIQAVCVEGTAADPALFAQRELAEILDSLQSKSLIVRSEILPGESHFRMLDTIHEYAWERLAERGGSEELQFRHAAYYVTLAEAGAKGIQSSEQAAWLARLEAEHNNLRAALQFAIDRRCAEVALRLAGALHPFWTMGGYLSEGGQWLESALALPPPQFSDADSGSEPQIRAKALAAAGAIALDQGDLAGGILRLEQSLALFRRLEAQTGVMNALAWLGTALVDVDDLPGAENCFRESLELARSTRRTGTAAFVLGGLSNIALLHGDYGSAERLQRDCLALWQEAGDPYGITCALADLSILAVDQGQYAEGARLAREALSLASEAQDRRHIAFTLFILGRVAAEVNLAERAVRLLAHADSLTTATGLCLPPQQRVDYDRALAAARAQLGEAAFNAAWAAGQALSLEQAVRYALSD